MRNRGQSRQRRGRAGREPRRAAEDDEAAIAAALSDSDLDEDLLDYLQNVHKQQQDSSDDDEGQPEQHMQPGHSNLEKASAHASAAQPGSTLEVDPADAEDPDSWRPTGLGYHPQHGFASASAAAQFADTSLDHMLEGNLAQDMQRGREDDSSGSSSSSSEVSDSSGSDRDTDSTTSSNSGSSSDSEGDEEGVAGSSFGASEPVVVDAAGRQQRWHDLSLEQRFPVQPRQGLSPAAAVAAAAAGGSSSGRGSKQKQRTPSGSMRDGLTQNISTSMLLSNRQGFIPEFQSEALAAAVAAATTAAAELAKQQVAQYAELAQQLQQAKQNQRQRPGRQGKGVKKQLKKAKVAAKRTSREARSEAGALQLPAALEVFVGSGQDMQVLPPCGSRQKEGFAKQLARLFGVNASSQGGGSSGRTCLVLQATPDLQQQQQQQQQQLLDESRLSQLQVLLRGELAKELAAATIARDDTVHNLKKKEKQRRRSSQQQQSGMQRQGRRGPPGRVATPDYQQPVMFVAAGVLDPNSSLMNHDKYMDSDSAAADSANSADSTESDSSSSSSEGSQSGSDAAAEGVERGAAAAAAAAAGRRGVGAATGPSHAEVGAFLESLLLQEEEQEESLLAASAAAAAAAVQGPQQQQDEQPAWFIGRAGSPLQEGGASRGGLCFSAVAAVADREKLPAAGLQADPQQQQQTQNGTFVPTVYKDRGPQHQQQQQQQQGADTDNHAPCSSSAALVPTWFEDKGPERTVYSQGGRGLTFIAAGTSDDDFAKHTTATAPAAAPGSSGDRERDREGPVYNRAGLGLGFALGAGRPGLGLGAAAAAETDIDTPLGLPREAEEEEEDSEGGGWERAGLGRRQGRRNGADSKNSGRNRVAQLEAEFKSLQTPGGRAAAAAAAGEGQQGGGGSKQERKQRRKQHRQQQQQQQRAHEGGNANLDAWMLAAGATAAAVDAQPSFNMTAQQSKKAKKQQQRNQRREAKAAGGSGSPAVAEGTVMQQQQHKQAAGFATFEVHTTGIGSRLLSRWGWSEGEGLGRARQGRANPLQAERRPKQLGLGYE